MAEEIIRLNTIVSRRVKPLFPIYRTLTGVDSLKIKGGFNSNVPNMWTLQNLHFTIVCDATVANRTTNFNLYVDDLLVDKMTSGIVAASETKYGTVQQESAFSGMARFGSIYATLSQWSYLFGGNDYLHIYTTNGVAGDVINVWAVFRWRNWDIGMMLPREQRKLKE